MKRRSFLHLAWTLTIAACAPALFKKEEQPYNSATPYPTDNSSQEGSPSPLSELSSSPSPTTSPLQTVFLPKEYEGKLSVEETKNAGAAVLKEAKTFRLQTLAGATQSGDVEVTVLFDNALGEDLALYGRDIERYETWQNVQVTIKLDESKKSARVSLPISREQQEFLVTSGENILLSPDLTFVETIALSQEQGQLIETQNKIASRAVATLLVGGTLLEPDDERADIIFIHGGLAEHETDDQYFWKNLLVFFDSQSSRSPELKQACRLLLFRYDSRRSVESSAGDLADILRKRKDPRPVILVGFSMGGLIARVARYFLRDTKRIAGVITLATPHHGSPLAFAKLVRAAVGKQPYPTLLYLAYVQHMNAFVTPLRFPTIAKRLEDALKTDEIFRNDGFSCLRSDASSPGIPSVEFTTIFTLGLARFPWNERLVPADRLNFSCKRSGLFSSSLSSSSLDDASCLFNWIEGMQNATQTNEPYLIVYGGYLDRDAIRAGNEAFLASLFETTSIPAFLKARTRAVQQASLLFLAGSLFPSLPAVAKEGYAFPDGMVHLSSALDLREGVSLVKHSGEIDENAVQTRLPSYIFKHRLMRGYSHLDMARGKNSADAGYFELIGEDVLFFATRAREADAQPLSSADKSVIRTKIQESFLDEEREEFEDSNGGGVRVTSRTLTSLSIQQESGRPNRAHATIIVFERVIRYEGNFSTQEQAGEKRHEATLKRLCGEWYWVGST